MLYIPAIHISLLPRLCLQGVPSATNAPIPSMSLPSRGTHCRSHGLSDNYIN